jgi:hypothetical protein
MFPGVAGEKKARQAMSRFEASLQGRAGAALAEAAVFLLPCSMA